MTPSTPHHADDDNLDSTAADVGMDLVVIRRLRDALQDPPPAPSAELAALLAGSVPPLRAASTLPEEQGHTAAPVRSRHARRRAAAWFAGLGLAAQVGVGSAAAAAGLALAGATDRLPDPAQRVFDSLVQGLRPGPDGADRPGKEKQAPVEDLDPTPVADTLPTDDPDTSPRGDDGTTPPVGGQGGPAPAVDTAAPGSTAPPPSPPPSRPDQANHEQEQTGGPGGPPNEDDDRDDRDEEDADDDAGGDDGPGSHGDGDGPSADPEDDGEDEDADDPEDEDDPEDDDEREGEDAFLEDPRDRTDEE